MNIQLIWHIVRKDLRHTWMLIAMVILSVAALGFLYGMTNLGPQEGRQLWVKAYEVLMYLYMLPIALFLAALLHAEAIPGEKQYWLARPIYWLDLLVAKVWVSFLVILFPLTLMMMAVVASEGFVVGSYIPTLLLRLTFIATTVILFMALLAVTKNLQQLLISLVGIFVFGAAISTLPENTGGPMGRALWVYETASGELFMLVALIVLVWQYATRRTQVARIGGVLGFVLVIGMEALIPNGMLLVAQEWLAPIQVGADKGRIELDGMRKLPWTVKASDLKYPSYMFLPVRLLGLSNNEFATVDGWDRVEVYSGGERMPTVAYKNPKLLRFRDSYWLAIPVPIQFFERHKKDSTDIKLSAAMSIYGNRTSQFKVLTVADTEIAGVGKCSLKEWEVSCRALFQIHPRVELYLNGEDGLEKDYAKDHATLLFAGQKQPFKRTFSAIPMENAKCYTSRRVVPDGKDQIEFETSEFQSFVTRAFELRGIHMADYLR